MGDDYEAGYEPEHQDDEPEIPPLITAKEAISDTMRADVPPHVKSQLWGDISWRMPRDDDRREPPTQQMPDDGGID